MEGPTVTGGIGSIVSMNHSGRPLTFIRAMSSSVIFSIFCRTSSDVKSVFPSLYDVGLKNVISFCFSPQCGHVLTFFLYICMSLLPFIVAASSGVTRARQHLLHTVFRSMYIFFPYSG